MKKKKIDLKKKKKKKKIEIFSYPESDPLFQKGIVGSGSTSIWVDPLLGFFLYLNFSGSSINFVLCGTRGGEGVVRFTILDVNIRILVSCLSEHQYFLTVFRIRPKIDEIQYFFHFSFKNLATIFCLLFMSLIFIFNF